MRRSCVFGRTRRSAASRWRSARGGSRRRRRRAGTSTCTGSRRSPSTWSSCARTWRARCTRVCSTSASMRMSSSTSKRSTCSIATSPARLPSSRPVRSLLLLPHISRSLFNALRRLLKLKLHWIFGIVSIFHIILADAKASAAVPAAPQPTPELDPRRAAGIAADLDLLLKWLLLELYNNNNSTLLLKSIEFFSLLFTRLLATPPANPCMRCRYSILVLCHI